MADKDVIRVFDMFCGGGGSSRGALMAGAIPAAGLDMWGLAAETYRLNFRDAVTYETKAHRLPAKRVLEDVGPIHLLLASPECTSHSVAKGKARRCEKSRETAFQVVRFARVLKPRWIIIENVAQMQRWRKFNAWLNQIHGLGYETAIGVINAQEHGVAQSRRRLFVVCDLEKKPSFPDARPGTMKTAADILGCGQPRGSRWGFSPLNGSARAKATVERAGRAIDVVGPDSPFIMVYYGTDGAGGFQTLDRPLRTVTTLDRFALVRPNGNGHEMRMLQPPELAAAMGFPRSHKWPETARRNRIKLIGNAVCPPVMRDIVAHLTRGK